MCRTAASLFILLITTTLHAEGQIGISAGAGPVFPVRDLRRMFGTGFGTTASIEFSLNDNISLLARGGFFRWEFSSDRINASVAANGGRTGYDVSGPFQAVPAMLGARFTFDGPLIRPFVGFSGGACFLHWRMGGVTSAPDAPVSGGDFSRTWSEPAISVDAGVMVILSACLKLEVGGIYAAFSNADDRIDPSEFLGRKITGLNTASFVGVHAGVGVTF
jgi:hypothetical protein